MTQATTCPRCGNTSPASARFCARCGASLNGNPFNNGDIFRNRNPFNFVFASPWVRMKYNWTNAGYCWPRVRSRRSRLGFPIICLLIIGWVFIQKTTMQANHLAAEQQHERQIMLERQAAVLNVKE
jgi:hypothetical protein